MSGLTNTLIELKDVIKVFKTTAGEVTVLNRISTQIRAGEFVSVIGRSGSGKSTLVNMVTGIDHPTAGVVTIAGTALHRMREGQLSVWRGKNLGIVFQFFQLLPSLTLLENVLLPMDLTGQLAPARRLERARALLDQVELGAYADKVPAELSGGQQQCAAVARALANDPPVIVADEPTGNLDTQAAENVFAIFKNLAAQGKTILMVTHDRGLARRAARTLVICDGELAHPAVSNALPDLPHHLMLELSRGLQPWQGGFQPGSGQLILVELGEVSLAVDCGGVAQPVGYIPAGYILSTLDLPSSLAGRLRCDTRGAVAWQVDEAQLRVALSAAPDLAAAFTQGMADVWGRALAACQGHAGGQP